MKVLFDALGSPMQSGGMRLHATQIISTWRRDHPDDELHLIAPAWAREEVRFSGVTLHQWPNESVLLRAPGQLLVTGLLARRLQADVVISLSPIVTPVSGRRTVAFQHDWRHLKNPEEFGAVQRAYRSLWRFSSRWADVNACISPKTIEETLAVSPGAATILVPNGFDDAASWVHKAEQRVPGQIITFGHHNNKRPELLIESLAHVPKDVNASLVVLGATGEYQSALRSLARTVGVEDAVDFPGFVERDEYERLVSSSSVIALVSSDEGFGLPIAEAAFLGIPALITSDSGMADIFGDYPYVAEPNPASVAASINEALTSTREHARPSMTSWSSAVETLRDCARDARPPHTT